MEAIAKIVPTQFAYISIPTNELRSFFDEQFASFAKCQTADYLSGFAHRYRGGHDLFIDVFKTFKTQGIKESIHQSGHILLTDFPTKAGIPIPAFSQSGLGGLLQGWGISSGWMQLNICDAGVGIIAIAESHPELCDAMNGLIELSPATFFDTFVEGALEITLAFNFENPLLLFSGIENVMSGCFAVYQTVSVYVDPITVFGGGITSAIIGFFLTKILKKGDGKREYFNAIRAGAIGTLFAVNPAFGFGAIIALLSFQLGKYLSRKIDSENVSLPLDVDKAVLLLNCFVNADDDSMNIINNKWEKVLHSDSLINVNDLGLNSDVDILCTTERSFSQTSTVIKTDENGFVHN